MCPARLFTNRILHTLRSLPQQGRTSLDAGFFRDVNWFCKLLDTYNGVTKIHLPAQTSAKLYVDASLKGIGAYVDVWAYHARIPQCCQQILSIVHFEMLNVIVAFRLWGEEWKDQDMTVFCDNQSVINVLNNGRSRDPFLSACVRTLWLSQAKHNIQVSVSHISSQDNLYADTLSRWDQFQYVYNHAVQYLKQCR